MKHRLSIIIINYDTVELTSQCLQSVYSTAPTGVSLDVIVVDNASPTENPEELKDNFPEINLIRNYENVGFGRANNIGLKQSKGEYVLFLNSDTIVHEGCLAGCLNFFETSFARDENIGLVGCNVKNVDGTDQYSVFHKHTPLMYFITANPLFSYLFIQNVEKFDFRSSQIVSGISGCFMFFRKEVFNEILPFDPDFFMYAEESELCRNRVSKKFGVYYFAEVAITHLGGASAPSAQSMYQNMVSFALYRYKMGYLDYILYLISTGINLITLILLSPYLYLKRKKNLILELKGYVKIIPKLIFDIPRYPRKWGGRKRFLKI